MKCYIARPDPILLFLIIFFFGCIPERKLILPNFNNFNINSYCYENQIKMKTEIVNKISSKTDEVIKACMDVEKKRFHLTAILNKTNGKSKIITYEMYMIDDMAYVWSSFKPEWIKFRINEKRWEEENVMRKQIQFIQFSNIRKIKKGGMYLLKINPPPMDFWNIIMLQTGEHPLLKLLNINYADAIKEMNMEIWTTKDFYPLKCNMQMKAIIKGKMLKKPFRMIINIKSKYKYWNHNKPLNIQLPEKAKHAKMYVEEE